ncbi:TetR family transcriptional regulator [Amycolatopsis sp. 195334CR]|uniref:acyl-CoA-like ligand-binding transcription factor n=1 Tax=Amycolatopsis sp. 195334CR TaxID=2814588 RepID=UPI001A8CCE9E|nr:TetR family transcriptional regulator [Amycolatopsis sp. 195334CR]MBN6033278.1 TetR family transcriptional regulator [Amycolatopsis sp. 195334CR]
MNQPTGLRERKKHATHRTLAAAAVRLAAAHGLDHVTVEDIAGEAGVSPRTFFNYFASKEDAVLMPYPDTEERTRRSVERFLAMPAHLSALAALVTAIRPDIELVEADREEWLARMSVIEANPALVSRVMASQADSNRALVAAIAERTGQDAEKDLFPSLLFGAVANAMQVSVRRWHAVGGEEPLTEFIDQACAVLTAGLPDPGKH